MNYIVLAIPVFFLLIGIELFLDKIRKTNYYRLNDAVTNLSCGVGSQLTGIFLKVLTFGAYAFIFEHYSPFKGMIPNTWWTVVLLFVGVDFFYYWFHRLAHEISVMWGSHIVHHQSEEYNLTVALRQAWVQGAFSWVFYIPLAFVGFDPLLFITVASFQTLYQFWIHTKFINKMHPAFEYVFNTPSHHRVHHGVNPKYIDRNHGGTLIIFDRMFGTFQTEEEEVIYGITKQPKSWNPIWVNFEYWIGLFRDVMKVKDFKKRMNMLFKQPGWKPDELGGVEIPKEVTTQTFHKYNTEIPKSLSYYVFMHFALIILGTSWFLFNLTSFDFVLQLLLVLLIIFSLTNIGGIMESKRWAFVSEFFRLLMVSVTFYLLFQEASWVWYGLAPLVTVFGISAFWFARFHGVFTQKSEFRLSVD